MLKVSLETWTIFIYGEKDFACNVENMDLVTMITDWSICNLWLVKYTCGKPSTRNNRHHQNLFIKIHFWSKFYEPLPVRVRQVQVLSISNIFVFPIFLPLLQHERNSSKYFGLMICRFCLLSYSCLKIKIQQKLEKQ